MSARRPIIRPESWSTTLKVRSSRSWPVPVRSESVYSRSGGMMSSNRFLKKRSRIARRRPSIRIASAGRMSSMYSGRTQRITEALGASAAHPEEDQQADQHRRQADEADLAVGHLRDAPEGVAPEVRREERQHPFEYQHQGERHDEGRAHASPLLAPRGRGRAAPLGIPEVAQEFGVRLEQHQVLAAEGRAVGLHAAVERVELRV